MKFNGHLVTEVTNPNIIIEWAIGNWCNFRCPYCFPDANTGTHLPPVVDQVLIENLKHLVKEIRTHNQAHIRWTLSGGEPTAQKKFSLLLETINSIDNNSHIMLITNGTRPIAWWRKNVHLVEHMLLSIHPESKIEHNIELVKLLAEKKVTVNLSIMAGNQNFDQAVASFKRFEFTAGDEYKTINLSINRYRNAGGNPFYKDLTIEQHTILNKILKEYINKKGNTTVIGQKSYPPAKFKYTDETGFEYNAPLNWYKGNKEKFEGNWVGYKCFAPSKSFHIKKDGIIGTLPCKIQFMNPLNIYNKDFKEKYKYPIDPYICDKEYKDCNCAGVLEGDKVL